MIQQSQKPDAPVLDDTSSSSNNNSTTRLDTLGVSVFHLQTVFLEQTVCTATEGTTLSGYSKIYEIENLQGTPGVIRQNTADTICPLDGRMGAAYVHCLLDNRDAAADHVGEATHMLSYSWGYTIGDIVDTLCDFCRENNLNPRRTYIWICCLCVNQHRVVEQSSDQQTGMLLPPATITSCSKVDFFSIFGERVRRVGHVLAMMAPWHDPIYLSRVWCIFELYTAHNTNGCRVDILMPPHETASLEQEVLASDRGGAIHKLYDALGNTKVQNAKASVDSDKQKFLEMIESTVGFHEFNSQVNVLLRGWMQHSLQQLVKTRENTNDAAYAEFCNRIGFVMRKNGMHDAALELHTTALSICIDVLGETNKQETAESHGCIGLVLKDRGDYNGALEHYQKSLVIRQTVLGRNHPSTATIYHNIGVALKSKGDLNSALEHYRKCLSIREAVLGKNHSDTAKTYGHVGTVLKNQGDYKGALEQYQKCLAIQEHVLGKDHPLVARTYSDIGIVLKNQGDYDGALKQYQKCLAIQEAVLGKDHHHTASVYCNIGVVLKHQGDYEGALEQHQKCLSIREAVLGKDHPLTKMSLTSVNKVLKAMWES